MDKASRQLDLFQSYSLNPTYEIKRQIRLAISLSGLSRDEIVDRMNRIAVQEGMRKTISKPTLDSWTKDSDPDRLPSLPWLTILCQVTGALGPIQAIVKPLGGRIINQNDEKRLGGPMRSWQKGLQPKRAGKRE